MKRNRIMAALLSVSLSLACPAFGYANPSEFIPGADGSLSDEVLNRTYSVEEVGLLPAGYAWEAVDEDGETYYRIITAEEYVEKIGAAEETSDDMGGEQDEPTFNEPTVNYAGRPTREFLQELLCGAAGKLPYSEGGRIYTGDFLDLGGVNNHRVAQYGETGYGVDSIGLLYWTYRAVFGYTTHDFSDPLSLYEKAEKVAADNLLPGDIGMFTDESGKMNRYGICVGYNGKVPVFAHMNTMPQVEYAAGTLCLSELKSAGGRYFNGWAPVEFHYFMRLDLPWEEEHVQ